MEESNFDIVLIKFKPNLVRNVNPKFETLRNKMKITQFLNVKTRSQLIRYCHLWQGPTLKVLFSLPKPILCG